MQLFLSPRARAGNPSDVHVPWYIGKPIATVSLEATDGGLPGENLEPLLKLKQGDEYQPRSARADLAMLYQVGQFAAVEVHVEPWVGYGDTGEPFQALRVVYLVVPPPRVRRLLVNGGKPLGKREIQSMAGIVRGGAFFPTHDAAGVEERVRRNIEALGFPSPEVSVEAEAVGDGQVDVKLNVSTGKPQKVGRLELLGLDERLQRSALRLVYRQGVRTGHRMSKDALVHARDALRERMVELGYPETKVSFVTYQEDENPWDVDVTFVVDTKRRVRVDLHGLGLSRRRAFLDVLDLATIPRFTEEVLEEAQVRLVKELQARGYMDANVKITTDEDEHAKLMDIDVRRGQRYKLDRVEFSGAHAFDERFLFQAMEESEPDIIGRRRVTVESVDKALQSLHDFYRSQGYLSPSLKRESMSITDRFWPWSRVPVVVRVKVDEGVQTILDSLELEPRGGVGQSILDEKRYEFLDRPFNPAAMDEFARLVVDEYREQGYLLADAQVSLELSPDDSRAMVTLDVASGPQVFLRNVIIRGNNRTRRSVIQNELTLSTGEPITPSALLETRTRLYDLDLFRSVAPTLFGDGDRIKDLLVELDEYPNITVDLGGGFSTDQGMEAFIRASHRNLWGRAHRLRLLGKVGLGYQGDEWRLDTSVPDWSIALGYEAPNIPTYGERLLVDLLLNEIRQESTYRLSIMGAGPGVESRMGRNGRLVLKYRVEAHRIEDIDPGTLVSDDPWLELLGMETGVQGSAWDSASWGDPITPSETRMTSGPGFMLMVDERDDATNPHRGYRWSLQAQVDDGVLSDNSGLVAQSNVVQLLPVWRLGLLLGFKAGFGSTISSDQCLPLEERFRMGGAGSLRGFSLESVGPKNRVTRYDPGFPTQIEPLISYTSRDQPYRWVPTGGDAMLSMTTELKVPLPLLGLRDWPDAAVVAFMDVGNVFFLDKDVSTTSIEEGEALFRVGYGAGFRYATPIGPLQLDLGINPNPMEDMDEVPYRVHLSLGTL